MRWPSGNITFFGKKITFNLKNLTFSALADRIETFKEAPVAAYQLYTHVIFLECQADMSVNISLKVRGSTKTHLRAKTFSVLSNMNSEDP